MSLNLPFLAVISSFTMFFTQIKSFFSKISSIFIESYTLDTFLYSVLVRYSMKHCKRVSIGFKRYDTFKTYLNKLNKHGLVGVEKAGSFLIFRRGFSVLFFTLGERSPERSSSEGTYRLAFIRGSINIEAFIIKAVMEQNESLWKTSNRFFVRKYFGNKHRNRDDKAPVRGEKTAQEAPSDTDLLRYLGYAESDLGERNLEKPFNPFYFSEDIKRVGDLIDYWYNSKAWYIERQIPWRFGCLLHGKAGTGKTSFAKAKAMELGIPIFVFDLTSMDNEEFCDFWGRALESAPCMILFEDFDRLFDVKEVLVTVNCLLNTISGVENSDGILLCVTANNVSKLDPAFGIPQNGKTTRPGRIDIAVEFKELTEDGRRYVAKRILTNGNIEKLVTDGVGDTGAQFVRRCCDTALTDFWKGKSGNDPK